MSAFVELTAPEHHLDSDTHEEWNLCWRAAFWPFKKEAAWKKPRRESVCAWEIRRQENCPERRKDEHLEFGCQIIAMKDDALHMINPSPFHEAFGFGEPLNLSKGLRF